MRELSAKEKPIYDEIARRLAREEKLYPLVKELAEWDATTDSWYDLFVDFQKRAQEALKG